MRTQPRAIGILVQFAVACCCCCPAVRAQPPQLVIALPADWSERDLEGKWVALQSLGSAYADDWRFPGRMQLKLRDAGEFALLELGAIHEVEDEADRVPYLHQADTPHWIRTAVWNLDPGRPHVTKTMLKLLRSRPERVLAWLDRWPQGRTGVAGELRQQLLAEGHAPVAGPDDLPALDAHALLMPVLDASTDIEDFGTRKTAAPGVRYAHQVVRALHALRKLPTLEAPFLAKAAALMRHRNESVRHAAAVIVLTRHQAAAERDAAYQLLAALPPEQVPIDELRLVADDHRVLACEWTRIVAVILASSHPSKSPLLLRLAYEDSPEAQAAALAALRAHGDPIDADRLDISISHRDLSEQNAAAVAIRRRAASDEFRQPAAVHQLLQREVWLRQQGHQPDVDKLVRVFGGGAWRTKLGPVLDAWQATPRPPSPFRGETAAAMNAAIDALVVELRQTVAIKKD
jgi:hypothetical protein